MSIVIRGSFMYTSILASRGETPAADGFSEAKFSLAIKAKISLSALINCSVLMALKPGGGRVVDD